MDVLVGTSICVLSDEIYEHLLFDGEKHVSPASFSDDAFSRTLVICGASKGYAMTGWRVGYMGGPKDLIAGILKLQEQRYSCVTAVAQAAAAYAMYEHSEVKEEIERMRAAYQARRNMAMDILRSTPGVRIVKPTGAFYVLADLRTFIGREHRGKPVPDDLVLADRLLEEALVATVAGTPFGAPGTIRMSLASSDSDIREGFSRIHQWLA
jgi:aspartate aminotransferase